MITRFLIACALVIAALTMAVSWMTGVRGSSESTAVLASMDRDEKLEEVLRYTVQELSFEIGARSLNRYGQLQRSASFIEEVLKESGYQIQREEYELKGKTVANLVVEVKGSSAANEIVLVGAHYDSYLATPGANCNASGVAVLLELAERVRQHTPTRTIRMVFFVNGESPWRGTDLQGAVRYAADARKRGDDIEVALILDAVGFYSQTEGSQTFPFPLSQCYPTTGNFIAFFGTLDAKAAVQDLLNRWMAVASLPAEGGAIPAWFPGIHGDGHAAFADQGYTAVLVTDTAESRWKDARTVYDSCALLDYQSMSKLVVGLERLVLDVASSGLRRP